jgi:hypothetical protein
MIYEKVGGAMPFKSRAQPRSGALPGRHPTRSSAQSDCQFCHCRARKSRAYWLHVPEAEMTSETSKHADLKQKAIHEFKDMTAVFFYLAFFFCALATYTTLLLEKYEVSYFNYGAALINALIITKIILIGEALHYGTRHEAKPLVYSVLYKAFMYCLLVFAFHIVEEVIKHLIHGEAFAGALRNVRVDELLARSLVIFFTFVPFFAFREVARVIGPEKFRNLFLRGGHTLTAN